MGEMDMVTMELVEKKDVNKSKDLRSRELIQLYRETGDEWYKEELFASNIKLPTYIASKFQNSGIEMDDLISLARYGMLKAFRTFDLEKDVRYATYSTRCMNNEILMALRKKKAGRDRMTSLDNTIAIDSDGNGLSVLDVTEAESSQDMGTSDLRATIDTFLEGLRSHLDERERAVLDNLVQDEEDRLTQKALAEKLALSQSYISRFEKAVKMKAAAYAHEVGLDELTRFNTSYVKPPRLP